MRKEKYLVPKDLGEFTKKCRAMPKGERESWLRNMFDERMAQLSEAYERRLAAESGLHEAIKESLTVDTGDETDGGHRCCEWMGMSLEILALVRDEMRDERESWERVRSEVAAGADVSRLDAFHEGARRMGEAIAEAVEDKGLAGFPRRGKGGRI